MAAVVVWSVDGMSERRRKFLAEMFVVINWIDRVHGN